MPFNINEFKSQMNRFGGPAQTSLFQVQFIGTPIVFGSNLRERDLTFFCQNATIPGMTATTAEYMAVAQRPKTFVTGMGNEPMSAVFMLDSDHQIQRFFHGWFQKVVNYSTAGGNLSEVQGQLPYEVGFKDEYSCRMVIRHYSTYGNKGGQYYEVTLDNAFPINVAPTDLSWANNNAPAIMGVSFAYDKIYYDGETVGFPTNRLSRGNGLLDLLTTVGAISQLVDTGFKPQGIQDAINKLNRFNNAVNTLGL